MHLVASDFDSFVLGSTKALPLLERVGGLTSEGQELRDEVHALRKD